MALELFPIAGKPQLMIPTGILLERAPLTPLQALMKANPLEPFSLTPMMRALRKQLLLVKKIFQFSIMETQVFQSLELKVSVIFYR